MTNIDFCL